MLSSKDERPSWFYTWLQSEGIFDDEFASLKLLTHSAILYKSYALITVLNPQILIRTPNPHIRGAMDLSLQQIPLYYYMQHDGSDSRRNSEIKNYFDMWNSVDRINRFLYAVFAELPHFLIKEENEGLSWDDTYEEFYLTYQNLTRLLFFVFQQKDLVDEADMWSQINKAMSKEKFSNIELILRILNILKDAHRIAIHFKEIVDKSKSASLKLGMRPILESDHFKTLLTQNPDVPLSLDFILSSYEPLFKHCLTQMYDPEIEKALPKEMKDELDELSK